MLFVSAAHIAVAQRPLPYRDAILTGLVWRAHIPVDSTSPPAVRAAIVDYDRRSEAYVALRRSAPYPEFKMIAPVWAEYERRLVAIADRRDEETTLAARAYVDSLQPPYEWEGYHDGPEREAAFADAYRVAHPASPFRDFLPLLGAHRWLCTEEAYRDEHRPDEAVRSHAAFERDIQSAMTSPNPLIKVAALRLVDRPECRTQ